jgi:hypothetical protein
VTCAIAGKLALIARATASKSVLILFILLFLLIFYFSVSGNAATGMSFHHFQKEKPGIVLHYF